jgi:hypothetical protein
MSKGSPCGGCGGAQIISLPNGISRAATPVEQIMASYGLCMTYDDYVSERCIWVVDLSDGTKVFQDDDRPGLATGSAWKRLGYYLADYPHIHIVKMRLRFGTNIVELPGDKHTYFYSRGLLQAVSQTYGLDFHIVGWNGDDDDILCYWYKMPELTEGRTSHRKLADCQPEQILSRQA